MVFRMYHVQNCRCPFNEVFLFVSSLPLSRPSPLSKPPLQSQTLPKDVPSICLSPPTTNINVQISGAHVEERVPPSVREADCRYEQVRQVFVQAASVAAHRAGAAQAGRARGGAAPPGHRHVPDNGEERGASMFVAVLCWVFVV